MRLEPPGLGSVPGPRAPGVLEKLLNPSELLFPHLPCALVILRINEILHLKLVLLVPAPVSIRSVSAGCHHGVCTITCHVYQEEKLGEAIGGD